MVKLKRAREPKSRADGYRVLVERLWPRGVRKQDLPLDSWSKEVAPSTELRKWFHHDPEKWAEFRRRYQRELARKPAKDRLRELADRSAHGTVTLVFSTHDLEHSNAKILSDLIAKKSSQI
jgi:uncharacterized protein YeaO (DUF488 family)